MPTLIDGREVPSNSEEWRAECEARYVGAMHGPNILAYVGVVADRRGQAAADALYTRALDVRAWTEDQAEAVAGLPTQQDRRDRLAAIASQYGDEAAKQVERQAREIFASHVKSKSAA